MGVPETHARPLATAGLVAALAGVLAVVVLHLLPPTDQLNPIRRTISEYALHETAWLFNLGLLMGKVDGGVGRRRVALLRHHRGRVCLAADNRSPMVAGHPVGCRGTALATAEVVTLLALGWWASKAAGKNQGAG